MLVKWDDGRPQSLRPPFADRFRVIEDNETSGVFLGARLTTRPLHRPGLRCLTDAPVAIMEPGEGPELPARTVRIAASGQVGRARVCG
jgi:hypothetical protein